MPYFPGIAPLPHGDLRLRWPRWLRAGWHRSRANR